ncbi:hypothetical protein ACHAW6_005475 [Cyclotella cf. meneghiniana]
MQDIQHHLESICGILPSTEWLKQCQAHLRSSGGNNIVNSRSEIDAIWNQILHCDLRDVCELSDEGVSTAGSIAASKLLRENIDRSLTDGGKKATLPSDFKLLVQLEEASDVSLNAEGQLGGGNENSQHGNNNYRRNGSDQNKSRSLKMVLSHGFSNKSSATDAACSSESSILIAMETAPIPTLSSTTPPGTKLLLSGPIIIRYGMLQLNPANALVVGGRIKEWEEVAKRQREKMAKIKGMGVDATVKALIWNPDGVEEEVDEGEGESSDVVTPREPPTATHTAPSASLTALHAAPPAPVATTPHASTTSSNAINDASSSNSNRRNQNRDPNSSHQKASSNMRQRTLDSYSKSSSGGGGNTNGAIVRTNPYQRNISDLNTTNGTTISQPSSIPLSQTHYSQHHSRASTGSVFTSNGVASQNSTNTQKNASQHSAGDSGSILPNTTFGTMQNSTISSTINSERQQQPSRRTSAPNPYASLRPSFLANTLSSPTSTPLCTSTTKRSEVDPTASSLTNQSNSSQETSSPAIPNTSPSFISPISSSDAGRNESFSIAELKTHLQQLSRNRTLYEQNYGKTFVVPCKMRSDSDERRVFNIIKVDKKKNRKEGKKYEFLFICSFLGPKSSDGSISCRVASSLMEPYFSGHSPGDIRKLQREDKDRANKLVNQSSTQFLHEFSCLAEIHLKLLLSPEQFFERMSLHDLPPSWLEDLENPVLLVVHRTTM